MRWLGKSIFVRLLAVLVVAGILINVIVMACLKFVISPNPELRYLAYQNIEQYVSYVLDDLGAPPDRSRALALKEKLGIDVRVEGPGLDWETADGLPPSGQLRTWYRARDRVVQWGKHRGRFFLKTEKAGITYYFFGPDGPYFETRKELTLLLLLLLTAVVVGSYWILSRMFRPLKWLNEGVERIGRGELTHQVPVKEPNELGKLATSFNQMTKSLSHMISAKEQLLLDVSHELRSPLTRMKVALELNTDERSKEVLGEEVAQMEAMVNELLENARLDSPHGALKREPTDLGLLLKEITEKHPKRVELSGATQNIVMDADRDRLRMAIKNIVENALTHSASDKPVLVMLGRDDTQAFIEVRDSGQGIPDENLPYVFEPFYRVDKSRSQSTGGFGLGLSLCRKIVRLHGGDIQIQSPRGQGTSVTIKLPLTER